MKKIKALGPQLQMVNASNILVLAKDDKGKVDVRPLPPESRWEALHRI